MSRGRVATCKAVKFHGVYLQISPFSPLSIIDDGVVAERCSRSAWLGVAGNILMAWLRRAAATRYIGTTRPVFGTLLAITRIKRVLYANFFRILHKRIILTYV
ncbi:hypothetical protein M6B38_267000 [Iris pallida]|uniref:Uncharacterized protein n=1 Tax=Iris pallida TaxID=29817 RepID=A0AAX6I9W3_IRIPA|nr:hypothetical protein M6B38_267000 [Iris pallida]